MIPEVGGGSLAACCGGGPVGGFASREWRGGRLSFAPGCSRPLRAAAGEVVRSHPSATRRSWDDLCLNSPTARAPRNGASGPGRGGDFKHPHRPLRGPRPIAPTLGFASPALGLSGAPPFLGVSPRGCLPRVSGWPAVAPPAGPAYWYTGPRLGPDGRLPSRGGAFSCPCRNLNAPYPAPSVAVPAVQVRGWGVIRRARPFRSGRAPAGGGPGLAPGSGLSSVGPGAWRVRPAPRRAGV